MLIFPTKTDGAGDFYVIRDITQISDVLEIELNSSIMQLAPEFILEKLAELVYGDSSKWYLIADSNKVKYPANWVAGDVIDLPNIVDAPTASNETTRVFKNQ